MTADTLRVRACAKVNLTLEVLGRRADGFHDLVSVVQTVSLADSVELFPGGNGLAVCSLDRNVPRGADNLAAQAYEAFASAAGSRPGVGVRLAKCIPSAAGLGGGSSDAAAVLRGLNAMADTPLPAEQLLQIAATLGSDVPFFLRGGTQRAEGRGERLTPLVNLPERWLVLVFPPLAPHFAMVRKTARLFSALTLADFDDGTRTSALILDIDEGRAPVPEHLHNTFDKLADAAFPGLNERRAALVGVCGHAVMCGAGPSLFALVADENAGSAVAAALTTQGLPAVLAHTVTAGDSTAISGLRARR